MNKKFDKNISWKLIYNDTFSGDTSDDKHGNDIAEGFYRLWYHTLLESVIDITKNTGGKVESVLGKGFNFFRLFFEYNNEPQKIELDIESYLNELYILKSIIFNNYKGYNFADDKKEMLSCFAECHCKYFLNGEEAKLYKELSDICKNANLDHDILGSASMGMLNRCLELYPDDNERTEDSFLNSEKPSETNISERIEINKQ